jgi:hypothetical protein
MNMMTLKCPKCGAEAKLSLADTSYSGPRRCWKCHEFFTITIVNNQLTFCEPLSKEEYERQEEAKKASNKLGGGIGFSKRVEPEFPQKAPERPRNGIDFSKQKQFEFPQNSRGDIGSSKREDTDIFKKLAGNSGGGIDFSKRVEPEFPQKAPEKPPEDTKPLSSKTPSSQIEPKKPTPVFTPDRFQTFVPLEDIKEKPKKPQQPKTTPERQRDYTKPLSHKEPPSQTEPEKPTPIYPPDRFRTFITLEDTSEET